MKSPAPLLANSSVAVIEWTARLEKIIGNILARLYGKLKPNTCVEAMSVVKELDSSLNACQSPRRRARPACSFSDLGSIY